MNEVEKEREEQRLPNPLPLELLIHLPLIHCSIFIGSFCLQHVAALASLTTYRGTLWHLKHAASDARLHF